MPKKIKFMTKKDFVDIEKKLINKILPKKKQTYTLDLKGQCYEIKSLQEGKEEIEAFLERNISFYSNNDETYPSPHYKIKVVLEELKDD